MIKFRPKTEAELAKDAKASSSAPENTKTTVPVPQPSKKP